MNEEMVGDVVVQSVGPYRVVMAIDSAANGCDGHVDDVFAVRSETMFPHPVSMRFDHARVLIRADHVLVISEHAAAVFASGQCDDCEFAPNTQVSRFDGYEVIRLLGDRHWAPFKTQKKPTTGKNAVRDGWEPDSVHSPRFRTTPTESYYWYDPVEYWDPCAPDPWGNTPGICSGGGGAPSKPAKDCQAGGVGSTSCGIGGCQVLFGTTPGCNTNCASGYYACCYCDGGESSCGCYKP